MNKLENKTLLESGLEHINIHASAEQLNKLELFKDMMLEWNEKINLTTITDTDEVYIKHFIDSATCLSTGYIKEDSNIIDVGTGAGFPGVPIKILNEKVKITLLDSLNKRIKYLEDIVDKTKLEDVTLLHARAEDGGTNKQHREKYDIALSRAVAAMNVLCEYCLPFVKVGGYFICQKGPSYLEELENAAKAIDILGGKVKEVKNYKLPFSDITHYIIIIEKVKTTPTKYPRKAGKPSTDPIV